MARRFDKNTVWRHAVALLFLAISLTHILLGRSERSAWVSLTQPGGRDHGANSLLGYSFLHGGDPFMKENIPHVMQMGLFCGSRDVLSLSEYREDFRLLRPLYSFLAALLTPPLPVLTAMLVVNWLSWALCVWSAWRFTRELFHSRAAANLAAALAAGGVGMTVHAADYSPHLLAFATYYFGAWLLYRSGVWRPRRSGAARHSGSGGPDSPPIRRNDRGADSWQTHLRIGLYLAVANLAYSTGIMLAAAYVIPALRLRRLLPIAAAVALGLGPRLFLEAALGSRIQNVEADYLARALAEWQSLLQGGVYRFVAQALWWLSEFVLFFDSPLVVLAGLVCLFLAPLARPKRLFLLCLIVMPYLASLPFAPVAGARGYLVYAGTIGLYACIAGQAAQGWKSSRPAVRIATTFAVIVMLATHIVWSGAHLARNLGPAKTYFLGWDQGWAYFTPTDVMSLTGEEPTPMLFGGTSTLAEAGAFIARAEHGLDGAQVSFGWAYVAGGFFFVVTGLWTFASVRTSRQRLAVAIVWTAIFCLHCAAADMWFRELPAFFPVDRAVLLATGERLTLEIAVSPEFVEQLRTRSDQGDRLEIHAPFRDGEGLELVLSAAGERLHVSAGNGGAIIIANADEFVRRLTRAPSVQLTLEIVNRRGTAAELAGWQRAGLPLRDCVIRGHDGSVRRPEVLPLLEVRAIDARGRLTLAGF